MKTEKGNTGKKIFIISLTFIVLLSMVGSLVTAVTEKNSRIQEVDAITAATGLYYKEQDFDWEKALTNINVPETLTESIEVKAAFNDESIFLWFRYESEREGIYHDYAYFSEGKWIRKDNPPWGSEGIGLTEDRVTLFIDDGSVPEFRVAGYYSVVHDGAPYLYNAEEGSSENSHKYLPATRKNNRFEEIITTGELREKHLNGYFLDLWRWGAHTTAPKGWADNLHIVEYLHADTGDAPFLTNWDERNNRPRWLFNHGVTGFYSLRWDDIEGMEISGSDYYYLSEEHAVEWTDSYSPQDGDVIPLNLLRDPTGSRSAVRTDSSWLNGKRTVVFKRALDSGYPTEDKIFKLGEKYTVVAAVHKNATSDRWNLITMPFTLGLDVEADITAVYVPDEAVNWGSLPSENMLMFYPAQVTWQFLKDSAHLGFAGMDTEGTIRGVELSSYHPVEQFAGFVVGNELRILEAALLARENNNSNSNLPGPVFYVLLAVAGIILVTTLISLGITYSSKHF